MRDWHHDIIRLDQALVIVNAIPVAQHNRVIVGVADGGFFEFKYLATPANELNYVAVNEGLSKTVSPNREKSSLIRMSSAGVVPQLGATKADYDTAKDSHATRVAGIIAGNKENNLGDLLPIQGIVENAELISYANTRFYNHIITTVNNFDYYNENGHIIDSAFAKFNIAVGLLFPSNNYIPDSKNVNVINASITYQLDTVNQTALKVMIDVLKTYGNKGRGAIIVAAAGNDPVDTLTIQGFSLNDYPIIVSASTVDSNNNEIGTTYSAFGGRIDLCAPSNNGPDIGIYTTTNKYCGDIGTNSEIITKAIVNQSLGDRLKLDDVYLLFPGNCVELGNPATNNHEVMVIEEVNKATNEIIFTETRTKTIAPYILAVTPVVGNTPEIPCIRIPILKSSASVESTSRNRLRISLDSITGFGYVGQKVGIFDPSFAITNSNPLLLPYFETEITHILGTNLFELQNPLPIHMQTTGLIAASGQIKANVTAQQQEMDNTATPPKRTENYAFTCAGNNPSVFDAFFVGGMVEIVDVTTTPNTVLLRRSIGKIDKATNLIVVEKFAPTSMPAASDLRLRSIGYGSYTSSFGGTSAAAPVISGVAGLMLKLNNKLNALEVKHILKTNAVKITGAINYALETNTAKYNFGYQVNNYFGTGRVNAESAVLAARDWHTNPAVLKPTLRFFDDVSGNIVQNNQVLDSPDIWIKPIAETATPIPSSSQFFNTFDTTIEQKIFVNVRNTGNSPSFRESCLRVYIAFTDNVNPAFPFPDKWYHKTDELNSNNVILVGIKEIPIIAANSDSILDIEFKFIHENWSKWNPLNKKAYLLVHIAPFDGSDTELSLTNIRGNKNLTCRPINVTHFEAYSIADDNTKTLLPSDVYNLSVNPIASPKKFKFEISNIIDTRLNALKFTFARKNRATNVIEQTVVYKNVSGTWSFDVVPIADWVKIEPAIALTDSVQSTPNYKNAALNFILMIDETVLEVTYDVST